MDYLDLTGMKTTGFIPSTNNLRVLAELTTEPGACPHCPNSLFKLKPTGTKTQVTADAHAPVRLPERRRVEVVTLDMSASLRRAVLHALPWAVIVVDRFHIQRMANQAVDRVRRRIHLGMTRYDRRLVMRDPRLLRKHRPGERVQ